MSKPESTDKPKSRTSTITTSLKVEEAGYTIYVTHAGMQLASVSPVNIKPADFVLYIDLLGFAIKEWDRAKQIEIEANKTS